MNHKKEDYKKYIWRNGWVSGNKRWVFHAHGIGTKLDGKVYLEDGKIYDWDITDDRLTVGNKTYTILLMSTNSEGALILKDDEGNINVFRSH